MRKFCQYRKCRNCCRGPRPATLPLIILGGTLDFQSQERGLIQPCTAFTGSSLDIVPKGKNIRQDFQAGSPESPSWTQVSPYKSLLFLDSLVRFWKPSRGKGEVLPAETSWLHPHLGPEFQRSLQCGDAGRAGALQKEGLLLNSATHSL